jgi:hypothetical protein
MPRETVPDLIARSALANRAVLVTGASGAFGGQTLDTVTAVLRAATAARPPRDVASTRLGTAALRIARHAPGALDRALSARMAATMRRGTYAGAELATGLRTRLRAQGKEKRA